MVNILRKHNGRAFGNLKRRADAVDEVDAQHGHRHFGKRLEVGRESAAAEIFIVGTAPVGCGKAGGNIRSGHVPPFFYRPGTGFILGSAGAVHGGRAGIDQMNDAVRGVSGQLFAGHAFDRFGRPIGAYIMEAGCFAGEKGSKEHGNAV